MITAIDTNVLLDVFGDDPRFGESSQAAVREVLRQGSVVACEVVWAEVASAFPSPKAAAEAMSRLPVEFSAVEVDAALAAGGAWAEYRRRGGQRTRVAADFLIGAHAREQADRLLTRDRGFYRTYFSGLRILEPPQS